MRTSLIRFASLAALTVAAIAVACGEDEVGTVRVRPDGGAITDAGDAGEQEVLACGVVVPTAYASTNLAANAKEELELKDRFKQLSAKMASAEGTNNTVVTAAELRAIYEAGTPSLKSISTSAASALVDGYFTAFGEASQKVWTTDLPESEAGAPTGGKYEGQSYVSSTGTDLRAATERVLLGAAFFNHALVLASGPVTEATVDRLLVTFGATPKLANSTTAGDDADELIAAHASKRDDKSQMTGSYRRIAKALVRMRAAAGAGEKCSEDLRVALNLYFTEWERVTYASSIYALNVAAASALASPPKGAVALHAYGEALGFVSSFKGVTQDRRKITDLQIDDVLSKIGATTPYQLVTKANERAPRLVDGINAIAVVYGFTPTEVDAFKKEY